MLNFILEKKRDKKKLSSKEINDYVMAYVRDEIPHYQMSAFLMACYLNGLDLDETTALTKSYLDSGKKLIWPKEIQGKVIDKHSTGGVGDKASFILAPLAAACGVYVPMIAGRGLGHTGGTVDKIETIPKLRTNLNFKQFRENVIKHGIALIGQTDELAPADKKIYALRDVSSTVSSIPLITASILSKKLAEGIDGLVMDVKYGPGAFMQTKKRANELALSIRRVAKNFNLKTEIYITSMEQPLGITIGHLNEIQEVVDVLKGKGPKDLIELSLNLAASMVKLAKNISKEAAYKEVKKALKSGAAYSKWEELIAAQNGKISQLSSQLAPETTNLLADRSGYISSIDVKKLGLICTELGGGRKVLEDKIDFKVGLSCLVKIADYVKKGQPLLTLNHYKSQKSYIEFLEEQTSSLFSIKSQKQKNYCLIYKAAH